MRGERRTERQSAMGWALRFVGLARDPDPSPPDVTTMRVTLAVCIVGLVVLVVGGGGWISELGFLMFVLGGAAVIGGWIRLWRFRRSG
jgi:hypothetical protein